MGVQYIQISPKGKFLAVADSSGEKINLYSLRSYKGKKYLWRGYGNVTIISIFFDRNNNYLGIYLSPKIVPPLNNNIPLKIFLYLVHK